MIFPIREHVTNNFVNSVNFKLSVSVMCTLFVLKYLFKHHHAFSL